MKDILRPMLELFVALPGLLLAYFPVKSYLKQSPRNLAAWLLPLMAGLGVGGGLVCYRLRISTVFCPCGYHAACDCPVYQNAPDIPLEIQNDRAVDLRGICLPE